MMKVLGITLLATCGVFAANIAIIDSGTDYKHRDLENKMWENTVDYSENQVDEDQNSYVDDIRGWNFAGGNNQVIDYRYTGMFSHDVYKYFEIQKKLFDGKATKREEKWVAEKSSSALFLLQLQTFGNFVHGTHVAGIATKASDHLIMPIKLIPTSIIGAEKRQSGEAFSEVHKESDEIKGRVLSWALGALAKEATKTLFQIGSYIHFHKIEVANGSFGTGPKQAKLIVDALFKLVFNRDASDIESVKFQKEFLQSSVNESRKMVEASKMTLFVFAAGNDKNDNDKLPSSPASINAENSITVAAVVGRSSLASFSSFGAQSVHVAAPGVNINSAIPDDDYLYMSGTSMAAPYVANVAGRLKSINPSLIPSQIKKIIMGTVDIKDFLAGKVSSSGIINAKRAEMAAKLSEAKRLEEAIATARADVPDEQEHAFMLIPPSAFAADTVLPLPSIYRY